LGTRRKLTAKGREKGKGRSRAKKAAKASVGTGRTP